jgi:hypothetical protein
MSEQELDAAAELWAGFAAGGHHETAPNMANATTRAGRKLADWAVARLAAECAKREELERLIDELRVVTDDLRETSDSGDVGRMIEGDVERLTKLIDLIAAITTHGRNL